MKDEHREKLDNRLTPLHMYKLTPKTNCGECGFPTCLAFATQVIVGQADLDGCPYVDQEALQPFRAQLAEQHKSGIGVKREGFEKALDFLRNEIKKWNFQSIAHSLGADFFQEGDRPALKLVYLGNRITVTRNDVLSESREPLSPYEKIFIFNYVMGGATHPSGDWVGMEVLPNSVSKIKTLKARCQEPLARAFTLNPEKLRTAATRWGREIPLEGQRVDFSTEFLILPNLSIRILWWGEDLTEGFEAQCKFLFDSRVLQILDLESLLFACEQMTERLLEAIPGDQ